jgi:hypothetical protein
VSESDLDILRGLTVQSVRDRLFRKIYGRAEAYHRERRVHNPRRMDAMLEAYVRGTELYAVRIEAVDGTVLASCTCPFVQTAICKHIGAVLLQWIREPGSFFVVEGEERPPSAIDTVELFPAQRPSPLSGFDSWYEQPSAVPAGSTDRDETQSNLPALLEQQKLTQLREIARQRGWRIKGNNKADYGAALAPLLGNPTEVARAVTSLSDSLREALRAAFVAEDGHAITPVALARVVTALRGEQGPALKPVEAAGLLLDLARWGLVMPWHSFSNGLCYLFPWEVQSNVPPLPGWCRQSPNAPSDQVLSRDRRDSVQLFYGVWERILQQPPRLRPPLEPLPERRSLTALRDWPYNPRQVQERLTTGGRWERQASRTLSVPPPEPLIDDDGLALLAPLTDGDIEQLNFVCQLLRELNLLSDESGHLVARREAMARFLRNSTSEQHNVLSKAYTSMLEWSELDMLLRTAPRLMLQRNIDFPFSYAHFRSELVSLRQMVLRLLATAGEEGWCALADIEVALRAVWPDFFSALEASGPRWLRAALEWSLRQDQPEVRADDSHLWQTAQGGFLRVMLEGPLHWLGFTELCLQDTELLAFRLRGLADLVWDRPVALPQEQPRDESIVVDEEKRTISVHPSTVPPQVHAVLGRMARLEKASPVRFIYRLDMRTAHASFECGESPMDMFAEWEQVMPLPVPEVVHRTLRDWWARYGQVRLYQGLALLELGDDVTLRELEASTSLSQHVLTRLTARLVVLPDEAVEALLREFTAKGYTPKEVR